MTNILAKLAWDTLVSIEGEDILICPVGGRPTFSVKGIFYETSLEIDFETGATVRSNQPSIGVFNGSKAQPLMAGDLVIVGSRHFKAHESIKDGHGGYRIRLHEIDP